MSCLSASTFTVPTPASAETPRSESQMPYRQVHLLYRRILRLVPHFQPLVTNAYRQVHLLYRALDPSWEGGSRHKCLSASTFTVPRLYVSYCGIDYDVTNAYRQVHLLYLLIIALLAFLLESQMPIGKYIYCTRHNKRSQKTSESQMPIGKYIYCTNFPSCTDYARSLSQMPIGKYIYCTPNKQ